MKDERKGMIDNRMVKDDHQRGISRVVGAAKGCPLGKQAHMENKGHANWKRSRGMLTPRSG